MGEIKFPKPPEALYKLPFEEQIDKFLDKANESIRENLAIKKLDELQRKLSKTPQVSIPTPLGELKLSAQIPIPEPRPPKINDRYREAIKASVGLEPLCMPKGGKDEI